MGITKTGGIKCDNCGRFIKTGDEHWTQGCHESFDSAPEETWDVECGECYWLFRVKPAEASHD